MRWLKANPYLASVDGILAPSAIMQLFSAKPSRNQVIHTADIYCCNLEPKAESGPPQKESSHFV